MLRMPLARAARRRLIASPPPSRPSMPAQPRPQGQAKPDQPAAAPARSGLDPRG